MIGPCTRGQLEADKTNFTAKGGQVVYTDSADPDLDHGDARHAADDRTTWQAYAQTINDITLDDGYPDFRSLVNVTEIGGTGPGTSRCPSPSPIRTTAPARPWTRSRSTMTTNIRVTADPCRPPPGLPGVRVPVRHGRRVRGPLGRYRGQHERQPARLANGADVLVHEVIDRAWIDEKFGTPVPGSQMDALKTAHARVAHDHRRRRRGGRELPASGHWS